MASSTPPILSANRYVFPGKTYIGQYIQPKVPNITPTRRVPVAFGKGSRLAQVKDKEIVHSFVEGEEISFPTNSPFIATLKYAANGVQDKPVRLYTKRGKEIPRHKWQFVKDEVTGLKNQVLILSDSYDPTTTFYMDYQAVDRNVLVPLPFNDLRTIQCVGDMMGQDKYRQYVDYYIRMNFPSTITKNEANLSYKSTLDAVMSVATNTGSGKVKHNSASQFNHNYNRFYEVECISAGGSGDSRQAVFKWKATPMSGGNYAYPPTPIHPSIPDALAGTTFTVSPSTLESMKAPLELGIVLDFDFGSDNFEVGDKYVFNGVGPALFEFDVRHLNTNETTRYDVIYPETSNTGSGKVYHGSNTNYNGDANICYRLVCIEASGEMGFRTAKFVWCSYRELGASGIFTIKEDDQDSMRQLLSKGVTVEFAFGATNFVAGDGFAFKVDVPFKHVYFKDDRDYEFEIIDVVNANATEGKVKIQWTCPTPESGYFGFIDTTADITGTKLGRFDLAGNLTIAARNLCKGGINGSAHLLGDKHTFSCSLSDSFDWSLTVSATDERNPKVEGSFRQDISGKVTGKKFAWYTNLSKIPLKDLKIVDIEGNKVVGYQVTNAAIVWFPSKPTATIIVSYRHRGQEPDPGQSYYVTSTYVRPEEFYNKLLLVDSEANGELLLGPSAIDNHLYIANKLAWSVPGYKTLEAAGFVQVEDKDGDGTYSATDYETAIKAVQASSIITDKVVLDCWDALPYALADNITLSDPFEGKPHLWWFGMPIGTEVGDIDTPNTLVYTARSTLQVESDSRAHGTRILVSPTWAEVTLVIDGTETPIKVDGSFYAWSECCKHCAFTDPTDSILSTLIVGFSNLHVHEEKDRLKLGESSIVFPYKDGTLFRTGEDETVDKSAPDFNNINAMAQKQAMTKYVAASVNGTLIKLKISDPNVAMATTYTILRRVLELAYAKKLCAAWQDESGNTRQLNSETDIRVYRSFDNPTQLAFHYNYFLTYIVKRCLGLYSVDTAKLDLPPSGTY